jgi:diaminopimelate decarboxylase
VGSGCEDSSSYNKAISDARYIFDLAREFGYEMHLLDLGGGWPGTSNPKVAFEEIAKVCSNALDIYFPEEDEYGLKSSVTIIAEPGRYYVASAFTLATMVIAKRLVTDENGQKGVMYYMNDGVYGSFNCTIFDHWIVEPTPFFLPSPEDEPGRTTTDNQREPLLTTLWGPTCDSMDLIRKDIILPEMQVGEWMLFKEMGAYTIAAASTFNGFQLPELKYHLPSHTLEALQKSPSWPRLAQVISLEEEMPFLDPPGEPLSAVDEIDHLEFIPIH